MKTKHVLLSQIIEKGHVNVEKIEKLIPMVARSIESEPFHTIVLKTNRLH